MSGQLQFVLVKKPPHFTAVIVISLCAAGGLFISGVTGLWDLGIYDWFIKLRVFSSAEVLDRRIATVDINDESIEILNDKLDTRAAFTDALDVLAESNTAVAVDLLFKYKKADDAALTDVIEISRNAVIAAIAINKKIMNSSHRELTEAERQMLSRHIWHIKVLQKGDVPQAGTFFLPFAELGEAVKQIAHINIEPDPDGIYRHIPLLYEWDEGYIPSLSLAAAVLFHRIPVEKIELKAGAYLALPLSEKEVIRIPVDNQGRMLIPYSETWKDNRRIPFHTVVKAKNDDDVFDTVFNYLNNYIALIAEISSEQNDFGPTPFERLFPLSGTHTAVISGILNGLKKRSFIGMASTLYKILTLLLFLVCAFFICSVKKDARFHFGFLIVLLFFSAVTFIRWKNEAIYPWYALPVIMLFFIWAGSFLLRLAGRYQEQLLLRNALSRYFPTALAQRIMRERKTELIPDYKDLTILFSDISGFTKWSSEKSPELVHSFLNDYLETMAGILFANGGTVDKFMGDGILAFFGDPFEMPDHCERCLKAAIAMQERIRLLAEKWKPLADIDLKVRVGINTGKVIVGNLGSKTRIEYTVIGAAVNLAQRMESNAPVGGILVTSAVWENLKDKFAFTEKRAVTVKGYAQPIEAYVAALPWDAENGTAVSGV
jgi:adenylate cyclase